MSGTGALSAVCNGTTIPTTTSFQIAAGRPFCGYVGSFPSSSGQSTVQACCAGPVLNGSQYDASRAGMTGPRKYEGCIVYCQVAEEYAGRPTGWQRCVEQVLNSPVAGDQWTCDVGRNESIMGAVTNGTTTVNDNIGSPNGANGVKMTIFNSILPLMLVVLLGIQLVLPAAAATTLIQ
ncbi:uncharacterized protein UTRI_10318 [Ustilago trichophora]|uniref:Uncharacterized protein n=1 Tax=Ustilago trichophora TaxID=86804 RepID=A0A5C3EQ82_9BASI|nr:uncharacterized protein UTRI_10318 [Ustilago trichophora]